MEHGELPGRILVTGADGKIGRALVAELLRRGAAITALSPGWQHPCPADRTITGDANTGATFTVLAQAGQRGISRAVVASSINASGIPMNRHGILPAYVPIDEALPSALDDWYSLSKQSDELTVRMAASRWGMDIVAIRYPGVLYAEEISAVAAAAGAQNAREGWAFIELEDAVEATIRGLTAPLTGAHVVGIAADTTYMDRDTEDLLDEFLPTVPRRWPFPGRSGLVDTSRARDLLGFLPRHKLG